MSMSLSFIRLLFVLISVLLSIGFTTQTLEGGLTLLNLVLGLLGGLLVAALLISAELIFKRFNLKSFNTAAIGLFFGYLMGEAILFLLSGVLGASVMEALT
jgi:hypothetical protein